tara:strand:+ start:292 stop:1353 length:1062 start_codon:yes stop_codon:yes gene_type:complete
MLNSINKDGNRYEFDSKLRPLINMKPKAVRAKENFQAKYSDSDLFEKQDCYICDKYNFQIISNVDRYGFLYPTGLCKSCGNLQQAEYYKDDVLIDFYTNYYRDIYDNHNPEYLFNHQNFRSKTVYKFVESFLKSSDNILEIGCGCGGIINRFHINGYNSIGLDYNEEYLNYGRQKGLDLRHGSIEVLNENDKFDLIILSHVLEHIVDPKKFMREVSNFLTEDGLIYIEVPSNESLDEAYNSDWLMYFQNAHTIHFNTQSFKNFCNISNFNILKSDHFLRAVIQVNKKSNDNNPIINNHYEYTKKLIEQNERNRKNLFTSFKLTLKNSLLNILNILGLFHLIKRIHFTIKSIMR